jgi:hypothetical protein
VTADAPTWGEIAEFLKVDGWRKVPAGERGGAQSDHVFYEKALPEGRLLQTHISHSSRKRPSPGRFGSILRHQIEVSREQFWNSLRTGEPVERPASVEDAPTEHEAWIVQILATKLHMTPAEIEALSQDEARERVFEHWSRPSGDA